MFEVVVLKNKGDAKNDENNTNAVGYGIDVREPFVNVIIACAWNLWEKTKDKSTSKDEPRFDGAFSKICDAFDEHVVFLSEWLSFSLAHFQKKNYQNL